MKKKIAAAWLICFALLLLLPRAIWWAAKDRFETEATENTVITRAPRLTGQNYLSFPTEFEAYYNDNVPFRSQLISFNSLVDVRLFRERSVDDKVVIGDENWLFYSAENDIDDYKGTNLFSQQQLAAIAGNLTASQEYLAGQGIEFVLFLAPNKETVYGEDMLPSYYKQGALSRAQQLVDYLRENTDIRVVYPLEDLKQYKEKYSLYWHYDTHWNLAGGYIGGRALLRELGIEAPPLEELTLVEDGYSGYDLARMMNLEAYYREKMPKDINYTLTGYRENNLQAVLVDDATAFVYHSDAPDSRKLFLVRDSFAGSMTGILASSFRDTYMPHWDGFFTQDQIREQNPDIFVLELVERRLDYLETFLLGE